MGRSLRYNKNFRYKCFLCEWSNPDEYEVGRQHFKKAHPGQPYNKKWLIKLPVDGKQPVAYTGRRKRTLPRESAEAPEDAKEEDGDYDDENYDGDGPPPSKLRRLLPYQTLDSSTFPTPEYPPASQSLLVDESSETHDEHQQATPVAPEYDPRLILSKEASDDPNFMPELHTEIEKAIARTKEATEQTAVSTIESLKKKLEVSVSKNEIYREETVGLQADVKARDQTIEFMRERLRMVETGMK